MNKSDDTISRQVAIDALRYAQHRFTVADEAGGMGTVKWSEDVIYFAAAENVLTNLPSAQQWIPVSERLPEVGRSVLLSVGKGMYTAEGFLKGNGKWAQYRWSANLDNVDAWAEMPEPWKGGAG